MITRLRSNDPCWCASGQKFKRCHRGAPAVRPGAQSPRRTVPGHIARPPYAESGSPPDRGEALVKAPEVIERMRRTGLAAAEVLAKVAAAVAPGVTTDELDAVAHDEAVARGAYPSPLNYKGFPKSVCTSVNEVVCHGIPDSRRLADGDICNIDVTVYREGVHGDTNLTVGVGDIDPGSARLLRVTRECLDRGIAAVAPGRPIGDIGRAIEAHATAAGYGVVRDFVGHAIGEEFHGRLVVPHYDPGPDPGDLVMAPGMTFTIEPMITMGDWEVRMWPDGWTAVTADGLRTAQFEHTLLVTEDGAEVLTAAP